MIISVCLLFILSKRKKHEKYWTITHVENLNLRNSNCWSIQIFPSKIIDEDSDVISEFFLCYLIRPFSCHFTTSVERLYTRFTIGYGFFRQLLLAQPFGKIVGDKTYVRHIAVETREHKGRGNGISIASFNFTTASIATSTSWTMRDCWSDDAVPWVPESKCNFVFDSRVSASQHQIA